MICNGTQPQNPKTGVDDQSDHHRRCRHHCRRRCRHRRRRHRHRQRDCQDILREDGDAIKIEEYHNGTQISWGSKCSVTSNNNISMFRYDI